MIQTRKEVMLDAVTATTTSRGVPLDNAGRVSIQLVGASVSTGTGTFTVQVSNDSVNWVDYQRIIPNLIGTNSQTDAFVASKVINANGSSMVFVSAGDTFSSMRVICTRATDGAYSAIAYIN